jgi:putative transposase
MQFLHSQKSIPTVDVDLFGDRVNCCIVLHEDKTSKGEYKMPRRKTQFLPGESYHLFGRGNGSRKIFFVDENYLFFLDRIATYLTAATVAIHTICLLPNHYHMTITLLERFDLSKAMMGLLLSYVRAFNKKYGLRGHLFESRFKSPRIESTAALDYVSRYVHRNPVEAGLVELAEDWEYSSMRCYAAGTTTMEWLRMKEHVPQKVMRWKLPPINPGATMNRFCDPYEYGKFVRSDWERTPWKLEKGIWSPL